MRFQVMIIVEVDTSYEDIANGLEQVTSNIRKGIESGDITSADGSVIGSWETEE